MDTLRSIGDKMSNVDFLNISIEAKGNVPAPISFPSLHSTHSSPQHTQITEHIIHTIHTLHIYPNGSVYIKKSISWMDGKNNVVKKKEKKGPIKAKVAELQEEEVY